MQLKGEFGLQEGASAHSFQKGPGLFSRVDSNSGLEHVKQKEAA
jgi:hypothetical protein